ncbi:AlbA family DNA-binding domain-containing protein [Geminisphaera colitermitum]|uniref:AlbA family DNA-binding domain-containing protein n=1 Tax=Geminisphaera colitermitum TaxID=1148786 RepID=UPI000158CCC7|nr:RNA-binding domain-containing protein [Geminisphaera colitermitum]
MRNHFGETDPADFKAAWPSDVQIAKHVLAIGNSGGGVLVLGVEQVDGGEMCPVGLNELKDKAVVGRGIEKFLPKTLKWELLDFSYSSSEYPVLQGKKFQLLVVERNDRELPYLCEADGDKIRRGSIFVRRKTESVEVNYDELQALLSRRIASGHDSTSANQLAKHIEDLRQLYDALPSQMQVMLERQTSFFGKSASEELDEFLDELIEEKKQKIRSLMD